MRTINAERSTMMNTIRHRRSKTRAIKIQTSVLQVVRLQAAAATLFSHFSRSLFSVFSEMTMFIHMALAMIFKARVCSQEGGRFTLSWWWMLRMATVISSHVAVLFITNTK